MTIDIHYGDPQRRLLLDLDTQHQAGQLTSDIDRVAYEVLWRLADNTPPSIDEIVDHFQAEPSQLMSEVATSNRDAWNGVALRVVTALGEPDPQQALEAVHAYYTSR